MSALSAMTKISRTEIGLLNLTTYLSQRLCQVALCRPLSCTLRSPSAPVVSISTVISRSFSKLLLPALFGHRLTFCQSHAVQALHGIGHGSQHRSRQPDARRLHLAGRPLSSLTTPGNCKRLAIVTPEVQRPVLLAKATHWLPVRFY